MNKSSSRSHAIVFLELSQKLQSGREKHGILNLIDLAGSEKASAVADFSENFEEMKKINLSLSALGKVIHALLTNAEHVPYRESKLTRLLQESLGGNFKTSLIVTCSPHPKNYEETLSTLRFGERTGALKTRVSINIKESPEALILQLQTELLRCKEQLRLCKESGDSVFLQSLESTPQLENPPISQERLYFKGKSTSDYDGSESQRFKRISEITESAQKRTEHLLRDKEELQDRVEALEKKLQKKRIRRADLDRKFVEMNEGYYQAVFNFSETQRKNEDMRAKMQVLKKENEILMEQVKKLELQLRSKSAQFTDSKTVEFVEYPIEETQIFGIPSRFSSEFTTPDPGLSHRELPIDLDTLSCGSPYAAYSKLEHDSQSEVRSETLVFLLKNQLIQASFLNAGMGQAYQALEWRLKLMEMKQDFRARSKDRMSEQIRKQNELIRLLQSAYSNLMHARTETEVCTPVKRLNLVRKLDRKSFKVRSALRTTPQPEFIQYQSPSPHFRPRTALEEGTSNTASMIEAEEAGYRWKAVRSSLDIQELYNAQLRDLLSAKSAEVGMYTSVIQEMERMVFTSHKLEREKWTAYITQYKENCEAELLRRQNEVASLNKVLAYWVERYTELQNSALSGLDTTWKFEKSMDCALPRVDEDMKVGGRSVFLSENSVLSERFLERSPMIGLSISYPELEVLGRSRGDMSPIWPEED